jgi:hypothetical protein
MLHYIEKTEWPVRWIIHGKDISTARMLFCGGIRTLRYIQNIVGPVRWMIHKKGISLVSMVFCGSIICQVISKRLHSQ